MNVLAIDMPSQQSPKSLKCDNGPSSSRTPTVDCNISNPSRCHGSKIQFPSSSKPKGQSHNNGLDQHRSAKTGNEPPKKVNPAPSIGPKSQTKTPISANSHSSNSGKVPYHNSGSGHHPQSASLPSPTNSTTTTSSSFLFQRAAIAAAAFQQQQQQKAMQQLLARHIVALNNGYTAGNGGSSNNRKGSGTDRFDYRDDEASLPPALGPVASGGGADQLTVAAAAKFLTSAAAAGHFLFQDGKATTKGPGFGTLLSPLQAIANMPYPPLNGFSHTNSSTTHSNYGGGRSLEIPPLMFTPHHHHNTTSIPAPLSSPPHPHPSATLTRINGGESFVSVPLSQEKGVSKSGASTYPHLNNGAAAHHCPSANFHPSSRGVGKGSSIVRPVAKPHPHHLTSSGTLSNIPLPKPPINIAPKPVLNTSAPSLRPGNPIALKTLPLSAPPSTYDFPRPAPRLFKQPIQNLENRTLPVTSTTIYAPVAQIIQPKISAIPKKEHEKVKGSHSVPPISINNSITGPCKDYKISMPKAVDKSPTLAGPLVTPPTIFGIESIMENGNGSKIPSTNTHKATIDQPQPISILSANLPVLGIKRPHTNSTNNTSSTVNKNVSKKRSGIEPIQCIISSHHIIGLGPSLATSDQIDKLTDAVVRSRAPSQSPHMISDPSVISGGLEPAVKCTAESLPTDDINGCGKMGTSIHNKLTPDVVVSAGLLPQPLLMIAERKVEPVRLKGKKKANGSIEGSAHGTALTTTVSSTLNAPPVLTIMETPIPTPYHPNNDAAPKISSDTTPKDAECAPSSDCSILSNPTAHLKIISPPSITQPKINTTACETVPLISPISGHGSESVTPSTMLPNLPTPSGTMFFAETPKGQHVNKPTPKINKAICIGPARTGAAAACSNPGSSLLNNPLARFRPVTPMLGSAGIVGSNMASPQAQANQFLFYSPSTNQFFSGHHGSGTTALLGQSPSSALALPTFANFYGGLQANNSPNGGIIGYATAQPQNLGGLGQMSANANQNAGGAGMSYLIINAQNLGQQVVNGNNPSSHNNGNQILASAGFNNFHQHHHFKSPGLGSVLNLANLQVGNSNLTAAYQPALATYQTSPQQQHIVLNNLNFLPNAGNSQISTTCGSNGLTGGHTHQPYWSQLAPCGNSSNDGLPATLPRYIRPNTENKIPSPPSPTPEIPKPTLTPVVSPAQNTLLKVTDLHHHNPSVSLIGEGGDDREVSVDNDLFKDTNEHGQIDLYDMKLDRVKTEADDRSEPICGPSHDTWSEALIHIIDGHVIRESSHPLPLLPSFQRLFTHKHGLSGPPTLPDEASCRSSKARLSASGPTRDHVISPASTIRESSPLKEDTPLYLKGDSLKRSLNHVTVITEGPALKKAKAEGHSLPKSCIATNRHPSASSADNQPGAVAVNNDKSVGSINYEADTTSLDIKMPPHSTSPSSELSPTLVAHNHKSTDNRGVEPGPVDLKARPTLLSPSPNCSTAASACSRPLTQMTADSPPTLPYGGSQHVYQHNISEGSLLLPIPQPELPFNTIKPSLIQSAIYRTDPMPPNPIDIRDWTVTDVHRFISNLGGCKEYADTFRSNEIDGSALLLLKEEHLTTSLKIKLGPALKIHAKVSEIRTSSSSLP